MDSGQYILIQEDAAYYIQDFKTLEFKPPDSIKEQVKTDGMSMLVACLTEIKSVNKTDVLTLVSNYGVFLRNCRVYWI